MPALHIPVIITHLTAREILDSRGFPTVEATCHLSNGLSASASVPSGASTGSHEALELRDSDPIRYQGQGVLKAVGHIENTISPLLAGQDPSDQTVVDSLLIKADGTPNKTRLGGNTLLAVSCCVAKAAAHLKHVELFQHIADLSGNDQPLRLPVPMFNIMNGGAHAGMALDLQEYMVVPNPQEIPTYSAQLEICATLTHELKQTLKQHQLSGAVGDEGGFAPKLSKNSLALDYIQETATRLHHHFGSTIQVGIDCAANTYYHQNHYQIRDVAKPLNSADYSQYLMSLIDQYHIYSLEDVFPEDNWPDWQTFTRQATKKVLIIGDDLLVTHLGRLEQAIKTQACTGIIIKPNQVGTVTETIAVVNLAKSHSLKTIVSHRSGETTDTFIADFAVGVGSDHVKFGAPVRGERVCKYNRLLRLESILNT